ncbi:AI-2E family transporter, partial [Candidatus Saccharibacteria bacterium]|nr:AI-2E family transporter [Candidatus Saccharibacteria bacterium]
MTKNTLLHIHKPTIHIVTTIVVYAAVLYALWVLRSVCLGALLGFIGYAILYQPFHWIKQWTSSRALAFVSSFLALIVFLGVCVGVIVYIAFDLGLQARSVLGSIQTIIPEQVTSFLSTYDIQSVITYVQDNLGSIRSSFGQIVSSIGQFFSVLSFSVVFVFVFLAEPRWIGKLGRWLNTTTRRDVVGLTLETRSLLYVW